VEQNLSFRHRLPSQHQAQGLDALCFVPNLDQVWEPGRWVLCLLVATADQKIPQQLFAVFVEPFDELGEECYEATA